MRYLTDAILTAGVSAMGEVFDSHDVINWLMTVHPQDYVRELYEKIGTSDPIHETHIEIGITLTKIAGIEKHGRVRTRNVRGQVSENQRWRKLRPAA